MPSNSLIYSDFLRSIKTVEESNQAQSELEELLDALFKTQQNSFELALKKIGIQTAENLEKAFLKNNLDLGNKSSTFPNDKSTIKLGDSEKVLDKEMVKDFLEKLKSELEQLKIIKLVVAFEPSPQTVEHIHEWTKSNLGTGFVLDIGFDKALLGGAIITFKGEYRDLTLKKKLQEIRPLYKQ